MMKQEDKDNYNLDNLDIMINLVQHHLIPHNHQIILEEHFLMIFRLLTIQMRFFHI